MDRNRRLLVRHTFGGPRFERDGLDIAVLPELVAYRDLVVDCAKHLWRRANPDRERLPANYEEGIVLSFSRIESGSVVIPIERIVVHGEQASFFDQPDEVDRAVLLIADAVEAASQEKPLPHEFPKQLLERFDDYGKSLRPDEWTELAPPGRKAPVRYTPQTRARLTRWTFDRYEDRIDLVGAVTMTRLVPPRFELLVEPDGPRVEAPFEPAAEDAILAGLTAHSTGKVHVKGVGEFTTSGLRRILSVEEVEFLPAGQLPVHASGPRIWERIRDIMAEVPDEELARIPPSDEIDRIAYSQPGS